MRKLCGTSIAYPWKLISDTSLLGGEFPECWKRGNVVPVHKNDSKNLVKNYRPVSLLAIFGKFLKMNYLLSASLAFYVATIAFHSYYLLFMHQLFIWLWSYTGCRGVFLDISKAFDKVWHQWLLCKLEAYGVNGEVLDVLLNDLPVNTQSTCKFLRMTHFYIHMFLINSHHSVNLIRTCRL